MPSGGILPPSPIRFCEKLPPNGRSPTPLHQWKEGRTCALGASPLYLSPTNTNWSMADRGNDANLEYDVATGYARTEIKCGCGGHLGHRRWPETNHQKRHCINSAVKRRKRKNKYPIEKTEAEWEQLTAEEYHILRQAGTERPFSGKYNLHDAKGTYAKAAARLLTSAAKFDSGCGFSHDESISGAIAYRKDTSLGMVKSLRTMWRTKDSVWRSHPDGQRYCVNSASIDFVPDKNESDWFCLWI